MRLPLFVACVAFAFPACQSEPPPEVGAHALTEAEVAAKPIVLGKSYTLTSQAFGEAREINIYAPEIPEWGQGYFEDPLPVLYLIDGGQDQDFIHIAGLSQLPLINAERSPAIVVGVRTNDRYGEIVPEPRDARYQAEFEGYGGANRFRQFLREEVQPFIRAQGYDGRSVVMGESLAGLFVLDTLADEPELFDDYVAISPSSWWDDQRLAKHADEALSDTPEGTRLVIAIADEGGTMEAGTRRIARAAEDDSAIDLTFIDLSETESHGTIYHGAARAALQVLHGTPVMPYGDPPWYLVEGADPPTEEE